MVQLETLSSVHQASPVCQLGFALEDAMRLHGLLQLVGQLDIKRFGLSQTDGACHAGVLTVVAGAIKRHLAGRVEEKRKSFPVSSRFPVSSCWKLELKL